MLNLLILKIIKFTKIFFVPVFYIFLSYIFSPVLFAANFDEPTLGQARPLLVSIMNWLVFLVGIVFVIVVVYGAWKASTATGDPRGLDSAKSTWSYAIFGLLVVAGFFALYTIISGLFGFKIGFTEIFDGIFDGISELTQIAIPSPAPLPPPSEPPQQPQ
ncbi:TPA: hypothetical protein DHW62_02440 [candidate division WWE3 bacterium]|uniref:Uncharacterized protein n=1 Tax=candidate division WWE3 bacterium TaxID=2053526 RepID=A0A656PNL1_UNCKA|nr:hypothetical protein P147_WWE3C00001G0715 [candidate division WWE3 bacterium RAAC2_WWE3_1]KKS29431.1 MAG: hypothetical protein UU91_C0006G0084 [candidate division WWE3 bacterium GW2011_GWB1_42_117]KKS54719.1 MAG: hypothetical protein UV21_C0005G0083 [candidate division WWE3 bacterium GW2011_GWD2_42_34]KKT05418.1 MAG: hypothetical protein UV83_C0004G0050 [candidate division WWE3 bacterium GW2011_GWE2_43_18]KKT06676.1 MAG: hypothetical protein UV84_C0005G0062 [candidate division WWE3 bacterium